MWEGGEGGLFSGHSHDFVETDLCRGEVQNSSSMARVNPAADISRHFLAHLGLPCARAGANSLAPDIEGLGSFGGIFDDKDSKRLERDESLVSNVLISIFSSFALKPIEGNPLQFVRHFTEAKAVHDFYQVWDLITLKRKQCSIFAYDVCAHSGCGWG